MENTLKEVNNNIKLVNERVRDCLYRIKRCRKQLHWLTIALWIAAILALGTLLLTVIE